MKHKAMLLTSLLVVFALTACNMPNATGGDHEDTGNRILTAAAQTVEAILTESPIQENKETPVPTLSIPTQGATGTSPANVETPTQESTIPCNLTTFIKDVTVNDGDDFSPGDTFIKTWRLKNVGSCTWTSGYDIIFFDGTSMGGPASQQLTNSDIVPGEEIDISVELTAPLDEGRYRGFWKLRSSEGIVFSFSNNNAFWVEIDVIP